MRMLPLLGLAALAGCAAGGGPRSGPVEVTRYHLGQAPAAGSVAVVPVGGADSASPDYLAYADAVATQLRTIGYTPAPAAEATYLATVNYARAPRGIVTQPPPVSIGLGGGSFGRGLGGGAGVSFGLGGNRASEVLVNELSVQIKRRTDDTVVWEGRAQTQSVERLNAAVPPAAGATRLASALFRGFPGESGITTTVP